MAEAMRNVPTDNYSAGRPSNPRLIVLHTAETPCESGRAYNILSYLANPSVRASAHYAVDPDETCSQVDESDTGWAAPGANGDGIQIEQAGYAGFTAAEWAQPAQQRMLRTQTAPLVAGIAARWGIPLQVLSAADVVAGRAGVVHHVTVSEAYGRSDHWDCGPDFPIDQVVAAARGGAPLIDTEEAELMAAKDDILARINTLEANLGIHVKNGIYVRIQQLEDLLEKVLDDRFTDVAAWVGVRPKPEDNHPANLVRGVGETYTQAATAARQLSGDGRVALVRELATATAREIPGAVGSPPNTEVLAKAIVDEMFRRFVSKDTE